MQHNVSGFHPIGGLFKNKVLKSFTKNIENIATIAKQVSPTINESLANIDQTPNTNIDKVINNQTTDSKRCSPKLIVTPCE
jgi:hypothetical protein